MKSFKRLMVGLLVVLLTFVLGTSSAAACDCRELTSAEKVEMADVVVRGIVERTEVSEAEGRVTMTMRPTHVWKGDIDSPFTLVTRLDSTACGLGPIKEGTDLLLYANERDGVISTGWCGGTTGASEDKVAKLVRIAGPGVAIDSLSGSTEGLGDWGAGVSMALFGPLGGLVYFLFVLSR